MTVKNGRLQVDDVAYQPPEEFDPVLRARLDDDPAEQNHGDCGLEKRQSDHAASPPGVERSASAPPKGTVLVALGLLVAIAASASTETAVLGPSARAGANRGRNPEFVLSSVVADALASPIDGGEPSFIRRRARPAGGSFFYIGALVPPGTTAPPATRTNTRTPTTTPTPRYRFVARYTATPWPTHGPAWTRPPIPTDPPGGLAVVTCSPTPVRAEIDTAYTPTRGFTPRVTVLPRTPLGAVLTPYVAGMSYAYRNVYAGPAWFNTPLAGDGARNDGWPYSAVLLAVTDNGPTSTPTRTPLTPTSTRSRTPTSGFTRTATVTPGGPTPPPDDCILSGVTCTRTPVGTRSATRTPTAAPRSTATPAASRWAVSVAWSSPSQAGAGVPFCASAGPTDFSSNFWFFQAGRPEVTVSVLDGCASNGFYWLFATGLTNVEVDVSVTDRATGFGASIHNAQGVPFPSVQNTRLEPCQ